MDQRVHGGLSQHQDRLLRPEQVAQILDVPTRTVRMWCELGEIPAFKIGIGKKLWRIKESALRAYIKRMEESSVA